MNRRTIEIALPTISWKAVFNLPLLFILAVILVGSGFFYWFQNVYPYFVIEKMVLTAPSLEIYADTQGKLSEIKLDEGDFFLKDDIFCKIQSPSSSDFLDQKILKIRLDIQNEKQNVDGWMDRFVSNQTEVQSEFINEMMKEIQAGQEKIAKLEKELESIESQKMDPCDEVFEIKSPCNGVVLKRLRALNEKIESTYPLFSITNGAQRCLEGEIPEKLLSNVKIGTDCFFTFSSSSRVHYVGRVAWISHIVTDGKVKIKIFSENLPYDQGLSATAYLKIH